MFTYLETARLEDKKCTRYIVSLYGWKIGTAIEFDSDGLFRFTGRQMQKDGQDLLITRDYKNREHFEQGGKHY